ncbi:MAG: hypothetical protein ACJ788_15905 [Ktedonobacteraceae bacterium]
MSIVTRCIGGRIASLMHQELPFVSATRSKMRLRRGKDALQGE